MHLRFVMASRQVHYLGNLVFVFIAFSDRLQLIEWYAFEELVIRNEEAEGAFFL